MVNEEKTLSRSERIRDLMRSRPGESFTLDDLARELSDDKALLKYTTADLIRRGHLVRTGRGLLSGAAEGATKKVAAKRPGRPAGKTAKAKSEKTSVVVAADVATAAATEPVKRAAKKSAAKKPAKAVKTARAASKPQLGKTGAKVSAVAGPLVDGAGLRLVGTLRDGRVLVEIDGELFAAQKFN